MTTLRERIDEIVGAKVEAARDARLPVAFAGCDDATEPGPEPDDEEEEEEDDEEETDEEPPDDFNREPLGFDDWRYEEGL
jgi:ribosomal protein L12E/L44/L45/RPP1/RPP2